MPQYMNTFSPRSDIGRTFSLLAQSMFANQMSPNDQAMGRWRDAETAKATAEAAAIEDRRRLSDPARIPAIVSAATGQPQPEIEQYQRFLQQGVPMAQPEFEPQVANAIQQQLSGLMALPMMTGDTNYDQYMKGVATGTKQGRVDQAITGDLDVNTLARAMAASAGKPTYDVQDGMGFDPYGGPQDISLTPLAEAMARSRDASANKSNAEARFADERSRGDRTKVTGNYAYDPQGAPGEVIAMPLAEAMANYYNRKPGGAGGATERWKMLTDNDTTGIGERIKSLAEENKLELTAAQLQNLQAVASNYFGSPQSPYYGNMAAAADAAYQDAMSAPGFSIENTFGEDPATIPTQPLPFPRGATVTRSEER